MKCSTCGRFAKGHAKPLGDGCQLPPMTELELEAMQSVEAQAHEEDSTDAHKLPGQVHGINLSHGAVGGGEHLSGLDLNDNCKDLEEELRALELEERQLDLMTAIET